MNVDEDELKELHFVLDEKTLKFVEANVRVIAADDKYKRERKARDFESFYSLDILYDDCDELGNILGEMFVLQVLAAIFIKDRWNTISERFGSRK